MDLNYNYVVFSWLFSSSRKEEDYYYICLKDLEGHDNIIVNHEALQERWKWIRYLYKIHHHPKLNRWIKLPFKALWYPFVFKNSFKNKDEKPICFICIRYPSVGYLKYLKKHYPNCKIVVMNRDLLSVHQKEYESYTKEKVYDYWMSYDEEECKKYGFIHFDEFESKITIAVEDNQEFADVFFLGRAKERLQKLVDVYDRLTEKGIKCIFYIVGSNKNTMIARDGIVYLQKQVPYIEMLKMSLKSRCILEINQAGASGYSSRFLEAVLFNKKLITDNLYIRKSQFYNPDFIQCITSEDEISTDFIKKNIVVDYHYKDEFSPLHRIEQIDKML